MKEADFLTKLKKEGKLLFVEPSEEIKNAYLKKSESFLSSAKILLASEKLEESVSMAYYSMYYITLALFFRVGIKCENHTATIILLEKIFSIDNSKLSFAKKERVDKQYYIDFHITKEEVKDLIKSAEAYNAMLYDFIARLNVEKILEFRKKFKKILR